MTTRDLILLAIIDDPGGLSELEAVVAMRLPEIRLLTTPDPLRGLAMAVEESPDLILLNHDEMGVDGLGFCRKLKGDERLRAIPVLFVSVPGSPPSDRFRALEAGAEGFLARPFEEAELVAQTRTMAKVKEASRLRQMEPEEPESAAGTKSEEALRESEEKYRLLAETAHDIIVLYDREGRIVYINRAGLDFIGLGPEEIEAYSIRNLVPPERMADLEARSGKPTPGEGESHFFETELMNRAGDRIPVEVSSTPIREQGDVARMLMVARDISGRRKAEEDRDRLQAELIQAQKMEAVGRLAGGVAHDFNNMFSVILGQTDLVLGALSPEGTFFTELLEIRQAAERSAEITRQLLAFARRQTIAPEILDLNRSVDDALKVLRWVIGEDVDLVWRPKSGVWPVKMDPSQIDQILTNLCVNSRDAMAGAGKITIETGTSILDDAFCSIHPGSKPGEYTVLTVRDTGSGMDRETMDRLFEPFFTTKELGKGTGLGLATTYGIVKQNDGFIEVQSEPGKGSVFRIYFPPYRSIGEEAAEKGQEALAPGKQETILLVEDEAAVLNLTRRILEHQDFRVLAASTPEEAIRLATDHAEEIHLLLTDVVMPQMNGRELAGLLMSRHPHLKVMFMSGYPAEVIAHHGVLEEGTEFIQKPYSAQELCAKVRAILDAK